MKNLKWLLLAAPAGLMAAPTAQAADLPAYKSAPVQYVRICDAYGSGFFYIPGTDTCLRVGGYVRFEMRDVPGHSIINVKNGAVSQIAGAQDETGMQVRGRIFVDGRTQTQWGTLQTYVRLRGTNSDGVYAVGGMTEFSPSATPGGNKSSTLTMERAFIRFAGLTAGISSENFSTMPAYMFGPNVYAGFPNGIKQLAYTATFGGGFSATLAIESRGDYEGTSVSAGDGNINAGVPYAYNTEYTNRWDSGYALVGNVRYDAAWGYAQIAGAVQQDTIASIGLGGPTANGTSVYSPLISQTGNTGWAASLSFGVKLPMLSPGDQLHAQFAYAHGFAGLIMSNGGINNLSNASGTGRFAGGVQTVVNDIIATSAGPGGVVTSVGEPNAYGIYGLFTHYWTPQWRSNLQVGYLGVRAPSAAISAGIQEGNANVFDSGLNLIWSPTKNFNIGVEVDYLHVSQTIQNPTAAFVLAGSPGLKESAFDGILRIERNF